MIAGVFKLRAKSLEKGVERMLGPVLKKAVYKHPLIRPLGAGVKDPPPSYIAPDKFAVALLHVMGTNKVQGGPVAASLADNVNEAAPANPLAAIEALKADQSPLPLQKKVETWFEDSMDRLSGQYKRGAQLRTVILAILVTLLFNADTLKITQTLRTHPTIAAAIAEHAKTRLAKGKPDEEALPMVRYDDANSPTQSTPTVLPERDVISDDERKTLGDLTRWGDDLWPAWRNEAENKGKTFGDWLSFLFANRLVGWIITALAVSMGAPFWFDTLNRFMNVRNAGRAPDEPRDKAQLAPVAAVQVVAPSAMTGGPAR
jgi:hypothetical protein